MNNLVRRVLALTQATYEPIRTENEQWFNPSTLPFIVALLLPSYCHLKCFYNGFGLDLLKII